MADATKRRGIRDWGLGNGRERRRSCAKSLTRSEQTGPLSTKTRRAHVINRRAQSLFMPAQRLFMAAQGLFMPAQRLFMAVTSLCMPAQRLFKPVMELCMPAQYLCTPEK